jgi:carotenoid cleavage dioxygenase-like enzyme
MYIDPPGLLKGQALFHFDPNKPMRFAVLPLHATSADQAQWFDAKPVRPFCRGKKGRC